MIFFLNYFSAFFFIEFASNIIVLQYLKLLFQPISLRKLILLRAPGGCNFKLKFQPYEVQSDC